MRTSPLVHAETTIFIVKYHQVATKESKVDPACIVNKTDLAVVVVQLLVEGTGNPHVLREGLEAVAGGVKIPSQVHPVASMENQLKFILR